MREKLEYIFNETFMLELWVEQSRSKAMGGESFDINSSPMAKIEMLQILYFPECHDEMKEIQQTVNAMLSWILKLHKEYLDATTAKRALNFDIGQFEKLQPPMLKTLSAFRDKLLEKYKENTGL